MTSKNTNNRVPLKKGYQPTPAKQPTGLPSTQGGYQPTSQGDPSPGTPPKK